MRSYVMHKSNTKLLSTDNERDEYQTAIVTAVRHGDGKVTMW